MKTMNKELPLRSAKKLPLLFGFLGLDGILALAYIFSIPADPKNAVLLGFSAARLALACLILALTGVSLAATWYSRTEKLAFTRWIARLVQNRALLTGSGVLALIFCAAFLMPGYWFDRLQAYKERIQPLLLWLSLASLQVFVYCLVAQWGWHPEALRKIFQEQRVALRRSGLVLIIFLLVAGFMVVSGVGINPDDRHWNVAGVPILGIQLIASLVLVLGASAVLGKKIQGGRMVWVDVAIALLIWGCAVVLWSREPMPASYFAPGPYPPNNVYYPYSDAEIHDIGGQYLLMGQGVYNNTYTDKPMYMLILGLFHWIAGQNYDQVIFLQILWLALFPVILYGFGKSFYNRKLGALVALLAIFKEQNAIASTLMIRVSHSKLMMTEFPTALGVLLFSWLVFEWLRDPDRNRLYPLYAGGTLGITVLIRPNPLTLAPFIVLLALFVYRKKFWRWVASGALLAGALALSLAPWLGWGRGGGTSFLILKIQDVIRTRYVQPTVTPTPEAMLPGIAAIAGVGGSALSSIQALPASEFYSHLAGQMQSAGQQILSTLQFVSAHFFHNQVMALMILPNTFSLQDLPNTLSAPYWQEGMVWNGALPFEKWVFLLINLTLLALGIGVSWKRWKVAGLVPVVVCQVYFLANSLARTSGGRYLLPVDWTLYLYYAVGVFQCIAWLKALFGKEESVLSPVEEKQPVTTSPYLKGGIAAAGFLALGLLLPVSKSFFPAQYPAQTKAEIIQSLNVDEIAAGNVDTQVLRNFLASDQSTVIKGRALYPRFYYGGHGEPYSPFEPQLSPSPYPRFTLTLLDPTRPYIVVLPFEEDPGPFPPVSDAVVIGCYDAARNLVDTYALVIRGQNGQDAVYSRNPAVQPACPLPAPVCDDNHVCR